MDFSGLADLIDAFASAKATFNAAHAADYNSPACAAAYERREEAEDALYRMLVAVVRDYPREFAAALRVAERMRAAERN